MASTRITILLSCALLACANHSPPESDAGSDSGPSNDGGSDSGPDAGMDAGVFPGDTYDAVWGTDSEHVFIAGDGVLRTWDGGALDRRPVTISVGQQQFNAIVISLWGSGVNDVWASVGWGRGDFLHWDGASWSFIAIGETTYWNSIWGSGANDVWAVGGPPAEVRHWDGGSWSVDNAALVPYPFIYFTGVWGAGSGEIWAVGLAEGIQSDGSRAAILERTQQGWLLSQTSPQPLLAIAGSDATNIWAVGDNGTIISHDASGWKVVTSPTNKTLFGVWASGPNDTWAVGQAGTILHFDGSVWVQIASNTTADLMAVWGSGPHDVWIVGTKGTFLHLSEP